MIGLLDSFFRSFPLQGPSLLVVIPAKAGDGGAL
jgi:hypothetical protein